MKEYQADEELANILLNHGFVETTSKINIMKGRKSFKTSKSASKEIYFNYINIQIVDSTHKMDECYKMTEHELKLLLLFFKLKSVDRKELTNSGSFKFKIMDERLSSIIRELNDLKEFELHQSRQSKLKRIIENYNSIKL